MSRCSKLNMEAQGKFKRPKVFTRVYDLGASHIEVLEFQQENTGQIQTAKTFDSGVCVRPIIYRDARKCTTEAL